MTEPGKCTMRAVRFVDLALGDPRRVSERAPAVVSGARELLTGEARVRCRRYRSC